MIGKALPSSSVGRMTTVRFRIDRHGRLRAALWVEVRNMGLQAGLKMAKALPKIWNSRFPGDTRASARMDSRLADNDLANRVLVSDAFNYPNGRPLPANLVPECIFPKAPGDPLKDRHWARITGGLNVISEQFRNVLVDFDLGTTQIIEVPYVDAQGMRRPGHWYLFHISEMKSCLVPEQSRGIRQNEFVAVDWDPGWSEEELLAVDASASEGVDLWIDPHMSRRIFLSDRLKSAIQAAGIRTRGMTLHRCRVIV